MEVKIDRHGQFISKFKPYKKSIWQYVGEDPEQKDFSQPYCSVKTIGTNGDWQVVQYRGDSAIYSVCTHCGFVHSCYKSNTDNEDKSLIEYDEEKEYNFCPECGEIML